MSNTKKNKHMTLDDRLEIQEGISKGLTFKKIAEIIQKDPTTISKEVKLHSKVYTNSFVRTQAICPKHLKVPFVCNGCPHRNHSNCHFPRRRYVAKEAQAEYEAVLSESREGIPLNKEEFYRTEQIISTAVKEGQHIYHTIQANQLAVSKSTVYRHIARGYYSISPIDLPRAVKFKPRKAQAPNYVPKGVKVGRSYEDFLSYLSNDPNCNYVEMDTVIGRIGGKLIMTFQFVNVDFMFGILLDNKTAAEAGQKIARLKGTLSAAGVSFGQIIPVLLTDNGGEFSDVFAFENDLHGNKETSMFFCDPNAPYQKPHVENNHTLFRGIVPSGTSFDNFSQDTVNTIFSHINAVKRKQFNGKSAFELFSFTYGEHIAQALGIKHISAKEVIQTPRLLKRILK